MEYDPKRPMYNSDQLAEFSVSKSTYLVAHPEAQFGYIACSALVVALTSGKEPRILLLQRAAGDDDDPNLWEPAGGACDDDDETILHGAARELCEETGLQADYFIDQAGEPHFYSLSDGKRICQFNFIVFANLRKEVRLEPKEHQKHVWATEAQVLAGRVEEEDIDLEFTREEVYRTVLSAFDRMKYLLEPETEGGEP